jgi:extracellular elastinolytic metalloproteinase
MRYHGVRATRAALVLAVAAALAATMTPSGGAAAPQPGAAAKPGVTTEKKPNYDARTTGAQRLHDARVLAKPSAGVRTLRHQLGTQGIVSIDPLTRTPRIVARVDGFLTGRTTTSARSVALGYVLRHPDVFRLSGREIARLSLRKTYVDVAGTRHLSFVQQVRGIPVFGNGLRAHVTKDGRLLQVDGSPLARLPRNVGSPRISAVAARRLAIRDTYGRPVRTGALARTGADRTTAFRNGDRARLVLFQTRTGLRLGWQTVTMSTGYLHVIDATSGRTLYRRNMVQSDTGNVWENYPGAPRGGQAKRVDFTKPGWLPKNSPTLSGNVAHVYTDANDNDAPDAGEEIGPSSPGKFNYPLVTFNPTACVPEFVCTWDPEVANSWQANRAQNGVQLMAFLGRFHDHLAAKPIGFTRAAGNFEAVDSDAVQGNAMDGAATGPDGAHTDNANMNTPPDGIPPRMQMYLFHEPHTAFPGGDPFIAANSGDEADIVYHEYTHGLSNRLVVDALGNSTLGNIQAGSMGEAWSDWYAMDYLVNLKAFKDTPAQGELRVGQYVGWGNDLIRTEPVDCAVGSTSPNCPGTPGAGPGGYTYGDFGKIIGRPEVHADGEIWVQTLWDLRASIGSNLSESLVTRAMELSPPNPSYLDMRNSILQADMVLRGGRDQGKIWTVFAGRGMGFFAGSVNGDDTSPVEDFSTPPTTNLRGTLTGTVRDADAGTPIAGAVVAFGGHASGFGGDYAAITNGAGQYTISGIIPGTYPKVSAGGAGFDPVVQTVSVSSGNNTLNWQLRRDWAASSGGGSVVSFTPPDYTPFGCGPGGLIDQSQGSGWGSDAPTNPEPVNPQPKEIVIELSQAVDVAEVVINPSATCGDAGSASTGDYRLETSTDGTTWVLANQGHFGVADRKPTTVPLAAGSTADVGFVRYTMISTQVADLGGTCPGNFSGCDFMDSTELAVYGTP